MGQLALGFRSLLIKIAIFFLMAGLLAWALGGTLFPKPTIVDLPGAGDVYWRVSSGGELHGLQWSLVQDGKTIKSGHWQTAVGPVIVDGTSWVATGNSGQWSIFKIGKGSVEDFSDVPPTVMRALFPSSSK